MLGQKADQKLKVRLKKTCIETTHRYSLIAALVFFLIWTLSLCGFGVEHIVIVKRIIDVHDLESLSVSYSST